MRRGTIISDDELKRYAKDERTDRLLWEVLSSSASGRDVHRGRRKFGALPGKLITVSQRPDAPSLVEHEPPVILTWPIQGERLKGIEIQRQQFRIISKGHKTLTISSTHV